MSWRWDNFKDDSEETFEKIKGEILLIDDAIQKSPGLQVLVEGLSYVPIVGDVIGGIQMTREIVRMIKEGATMDEIIGLGLSSIPVVGDVIGGVQITEEIFNEITGTYDVAAIAATASDDQAAAYNDVAAAQNDQLDNFWGDVELLGLTVEEQKQKILDLLTGVTEVVAEGAEGANAEEKQKQELLDFLNGVTEGVTEGANTIAKADANAKAWEKYYKDLAAYNAYTATGTCANTLQDFRKQFCN